MGVSVRAIIPNGFTDVSNAEAAKAELERIEQRLKSYFHVDRAFEPLCDIVENIGLQNRYTLVTPLESIAIILGNGFLLINSGWNYSQYFWIKEMWLRHMFYDIVTALGADKAIICDDGDRHLYINGKDIDDYDFTLEDWYAEFPNMPSVDKSMFYEDDTPQRPEEEGACFDNFEECKQRRKRLEERFPEYRILTVCPIGGRFIMAVNRDSKLVLLNLDTGKPLNCGAITGIDCCFNTYAFSLYKGNRYAVFSPEGKRLTPYRVKRQYGMKSLGPKDKYYHDTIVIYDGKTKKEIYRYKYR